MKITKTQNGSALTVALEGRLDTTTAPQLEKELKDGLAEITELTFDLGNLEYITSAGLRVMLVAQRSIKYGGTMKVVNTNEIVREVFKVTGLDSVVTIE